jgi:hypothetical protein
MRSGHQADTRPRADSMPFEQRGRDGKVRAERPGATDRRIVASSGFSRSVGDQSTFAKEARVS